MTSPIGQGDWARAHLDATTKCVRAIGNNAGLGNPANSQPGRLRYVAPGVPPASSASVPLPFLVVVSRCAPFLVRDRGNSTG